MVPCSTFSLPAQRRRPAADLASEGGDRLDADTVPGPGTQARQRQQVAAAVQHHHTASRGRQSGALLRRGPQPLLKRDRQSVSQSSGQTGLWLLLLQLPAGGRGPPST